jgi:hypothetical protein
MKHRTFAGAGRHRRYGPTTALPGDALETVRGGRDEAADGDYEEKNDVA